MSANPYVVFRRLIPTYPLQVAAVVASSGGESLVEFPGGGRATVRGTAGVAAQVYVRDNVIEDNAPTLPIELIEV